MKATHRLLVAAVLCTPLLSAGCNQVFLFTREDEIALGEKYGPEFEKQFGGRVEDPAVQAYVDRVGRKLEAVADRKMPYKFAALKSDVPNAFALPGGPTYVTAGLLKSMKSESELAAVLGHEIGHTVHQDSMKGLQRQVGVELLATVVAEALGGSGGELAGTATKIVGGLMELRYSRDQEYAADQAGIEYMARAGYSPWGMVELLETLNEGAEQQPGQFAEFFMTHPLTTKRIEEAEATIRQQHPAAVRDAAAPPNQQEFLRIQRILGALPPAPAAPAAAEALAPSGSSGSVTPGPSDKAGTVVIPE